MNTRRATAVIGKFALGAALAFVVFGSDVVAAHAAAKPVTTPKVSLEISGWIPYWKKASGTPEAITHLASFKEVNPFGYTVKQDGTLFDAMKIDADPWSALASAARANHVRFIPTVMWANADTIHAILKNATKRRALEDEIANLVYAKGFDGIDVDFEGKKADTKPYFSLFLKGLAMRLKDKWVMCTIEPRTPLDSRFDTIPKDIRYSNDLVAINAYCDRVRIMAYDQGSIDLKLNRAAVGPYVPVADPKWVEKGIRFVTKTISKRKLVIGIPTYGYEFEVTPLANGYRYDLLWAFNQKYALDLAFTLGITPQRNSAGEKSFIYQPATSSASSPSAAIVTDVTLSNNAPIATTTFSQSATTTPDGKPFRILWWSDAQAVKDKINLARKLGVRGVAIFKIDGGADPALWDVLR